MDEATGIEQRVREAIAAVGATCEPLPCDPAYADTAAFCARYGVDPADSANAILIASSRPPGRHALCLLLATTRLDVNGAVCRLLDVRRASFASADETRARTGMSIGGVTPFGLPADLPIYVDARVMTRASVVIGGGSRSLKLRCAPAELAKIPGVQVVGDLARDRDPPP